MFLSQRKVPTKAVIISRVSSKDQDDGYSLDGQKFRSESYCVRNNLEIIEIFTIVESSTNGKRTKFMKAMKFAVDYAKKHKEIIAVVTDKVDRLQRSFKECVMLGGLIEEEKIELHFPADSCVIHKYSSSQEKMIWNIWVMMAQNYVDSLRDNVKRSIEQKIRCGEWISTAPVGYLHNTDQTKKGTERIYIDPARSPFIKKIFELYASGLHTLPEILKMTKEWGLTNSRGHQGYLCRSHIFEIIQNPFYYGVMRLQKTGQQFPHIYTPIISKELFDKCQDVRLGRKQSSYKYKEKEFIFRGLIKCSNTGKVATSVIKKGVYTYLMVWDANNHERPLYVREEKILEEVEAVLASLQLAPELLHEIIAYIKNSANAEQEYYKKRIKELNVESAELKDSMDRVTNLYIKGRISEEEHETKRLELAQKRREIAKEIELRDKEDDSFAKMLVSLISTASSSYQIFKNSNTGEKRRLINSIFGNFILKPEKLDFKLRPPFDTLVNLPKNGEWYPLV